MTITKAKKELCWTRQEVRRCISELVFQCEMLADAKRELARARQQMRRRK